MPLQLGAAFAPRVVVEVEEPRHEVTVESLQSEMLLSALLDLRAALAEMPAPVVHVDQPDLTGIVGLVVEAVTDSKFPLVEPECERSHNGAAEAEHTGLRH